MRSTTEGAFQVSYDDIEWKEIRDTQGWAGLQHHSLIRATLTIWPPSTPIDPDGAQFPRAIFASVSQGSMFALLSRSTAATKNEKPTWHMGNIYAMREVPQRISLPGDISTTSPTQFDLLISADYEIRLFGDPRVTAQSDSPVTKVAVRLALGSENLEEPRIQLGEDHIAPDFEGGWAVGDAVGVEVTSHGGDWTVIEVKSLDPRLSFSLKEPYLLIIDGQTRRVPLLMTQVGPLVRTTPLRFEITFRKEGPETYRTLSLSLPVTHVPKISSMSLAGRRAMAPLKQTYWAPHVAVALLLPPLLNGPLENDALALHGAGVSLSSPFWPAALPRLDHSWIVIPSGGSDWGYDWRGPSTQDAFAALESLQTRVRDVSSTPRKAVVIGHSNGGQGTFYLASRHPDRFDSALPAAAYQSAPLYVPNTWSHGAHFIDPALEAILRASTVGSDNDIFFGNLVRSRLKVIHGSKDTNVPAYHSRTAVQAVKTWEKEADIELLEVPGKDHWWGEVFSDPSRADLFSEYVVEDPTRRIPENFTLSVMWPHESGSMGGWRILDVEVPGKMARLKVSQWFALRTTNARVVSLDLYKAFQTKQYSGYITMDGKRISLGSNELSGNIAIFERRSDGTWEYSHMTSSEPVIRGPSSRILVSKRPLTIVTSSRTVSVARRLAWGLYTYLGLDTQVIYDSESRRNFADEAGGNVIVLSQGNETSILRNRMLANIGSDFNFYKNGAVSIRDRYFDSASTGVIFAQGPRHLFMHGIDEDGLERIFRLFPMRTGMPCPEWMIVDKRADSFSFGGILGAGFWGHDGRWSEEMSWLED